jgi:predicted ArsR family transcriptional regulator
MNRKDFMKKTCGLGAALALAGTAKAQTEEKEVEEKADPMQKFREGWVVSFLKNVDSQFDEAKRIRLMESCGRDCARRGATQMAEACKGDADKLVAKLGEMLGKENARRENGAIRLVYEKCYCPMVSKGPARLSDTYCNCSRGWAMEMFETASGKPVKVKCLASIKRGDARCEFEVKIS